MATTTLSEVRGPLNSINDALSGAHGAEWLDLLKRLLRGDLVSKPFSVWKSIKLRAGDWTEETIRNEYTKHNLGFYYEWVPRAISMLLPLAEDVVIDLVVLNVSEMGFKYPSINDILDHATSLGLEICPPQVGLELALEWFPQPKDVPLYVGMEPIVNGLHGHGIADRSCIFFVANYAGKKELGMFYDAFKDKPIFNGSDKFVFIQRRTTASLAMLRELAMHLAYDAEVTGYRSQGDPVGRLRLSESEGSLWKRIIDALGGKPDIITDVVAPAIRKRLEE